MSERELKECPFCGGSIVDEYSNFVSCPDCGIEMFADSREDIRDKWNTRTPDPDLVEAVELLSKASPLYWIVNEDMTGAKEYEKEVIRLLSRMEESYE